MIGEDGKDEVVAVEQPVIAPVRRHNWKLWGQSVLVLVLAVTTMVGVKLVQNRTLNQVLAVGEAVNFYFNPAAATILPGQTLQTQLMLDAKTNQIGFVRTEVTFDPAKVKLTKEIAAGTLLKQAIEVTSMAEANLTGKFVVAVGLSTADRLNPPTGQFSLATLTWEGASTQASGSASATVTIASSQVANMTPTNLPLSATGLSLLLNPIATVTPTPTHLPAATPTRIPTIIPTRVPTATPTGIPTVAPTRIPTATPIPLPTPTITSLVFKPTADVNIYWNAWQSRNGERNRIKTSTLDLSSFPVIRNFLMKFEVQGIGSRRVIGAKVRLYNTNSSFSGGRFFITNTNWDANTVTWRNAPGAYGLLDSLGRVSSGKWYEIDVQDLVRGDGSYAIRGMSWSWNSVSYSSSRGSHPPELVVSVK
jgi:hypothetical protein